MAQEEFVGLAGAVATRADDTDLYSDSSSGPAPFNFKLNVGARLADVTESAAPLPDLDSPLIRKLTWEHVDADESDLPVAAPLSSLLSPARDIAPLQLSPALHRDIVFEPSAAPLEFELPPLLLPSAFTDVPPSHDEVDDVSIEADDVAADELIEPEPEPEIEAEPEPAPEIEAEPEPEPEDVDDTWNEEAADDDDDDEIIATPDSAVVRSAPPRHSYNRLDSIPDLDEEDDDGLIELPPIAQSGPVVASAPAVEYAPILNESSYVVPVLPAVQRSVAVADNKPKRSAPKRQKRHLVRSFMTMVVVFGLLGAGAFTAKKYLLGQPSWAVEMKPLADDVAAERGLQFKSAVEVSQLPITDYATQLAKSAGVSGKDAATWRALGLLNGELDPVAIGRQALNDAPAFYDPATKTILVVADLKPQPHLYRFAMRRALTAALLDQQFDWGAKVASASPSAALAIRATIDGDALAVANSLAANDAPDQLAPELFAFVQGHGSVVASSQFAATIAGRAGVALRPTIASMAGDHAAVSALEQASPTTDAVLDVARTPTAMTPSGAAGMTFWYYVLAGRIDDGQAWQAMTHWSSATVETSAGSTNQCVDVKLSAADADGAAVLLSAFEAWAAAAPAESSTTVVPIDGNQVAIRACDPGVTVAAHNESKIPVVFGGAAVERALVQAAVSASNGATVDTACLVAAARQRGTVLTSPADDAPVLAVSWAPAYVAANLDLAAGCTTPAG
jgi:hypothetical protein